MPRGTAVYISEVPLACHSARRILCLSQNALISPFTREDVTIPTDSACKEGVLLYRSVFAPHYSHGSDLRMVTRPLVAWGRRLRAAPLSLALWGSMNLRSQPGLKLHCKGQAASVHPLSGVESSRGRFCWRAHLQLTSVRSFSQSEH